MVRVYRSGEGFATRASLAGGRGYAVFWQFEGLETSDPDFSSEEKVAAIRPQFLDRSALRGVAYQAALQHAAGQGQ